MDNDACHTPSYACHAPVFDCRGCGHCCQGVGGIVLSVADLDRLCNNLGCTAADFQQKYGEIRNGKLYIRTGQDNYCIFFDTATGCGIHSFKPAVCKAWPFFRGNLMDGESLELAKGYCPGIKKDAPLQEFSREGLAYLQEHNLACTTEHAYARALQVGDLLRDPS